MATRANRVVQCAVGSTTASNRLVARHVPRHSLARRCLSAVPCSSSAVEPPMMDWTTPRDVLVRTKSGSGKTPSYIITAVESRLGRLGHHATPAVNDAVLDSSPYTAGRTEPARRHSCMGPLILSPTRELAVQIASDVQRLTMHRKGFEVQILAGGSDQAQQKKDWMESSRDLVVATPGRLRDLLANESEFRQGFKGCPMLILDGADTLLSMGFRDDIEAIVSFLPPSPLRQTILFSTTLPRAVRQFVSWTLSPDHAFVDAAPPEHGLTQYQDEEHSAGTKLLVPRRVEQFYVLCRTASDQLHILLKLLAHDQLTHGSRSKVVVFCPTAQMAELFVVVLRTLVEKVLPDTSTEIVKMHWKMKQLEINRARALFRKTQNGQPVVLVTSDISARTADYPGVTRMIQVGIPNRESLHIQRIRRMSQAGDPFVPEGGMENNRLTVRADLLLLPWEAGYMHWQLTTLPIKPLPISVLDGQLSSLSPHFHILAAESALAEIRRSVDPADVRRTAASLLGYYLPLTPPLRLQPHAVLAGVSSWASECFHVSIPAIKRFPRKFTEAYEQSVQSRKTDSGLFVDGLKLAGPTLLGKAKSKNRSVWEGANTRKRKPKRWY